MFFFDSTMLIVLPFLVLAMIASSNVNATFKRYSQQHSRRGITGAQAARTVLDANGLQNVRIEHVAGKLTDHYDPRGNVIRLSNDVYSSTSTAAIGVAAHEAGHALQYATSYPPIRWRAAILPLTNIGSKMAMPLFFVGILLSSFGQIFITLAYVGIGAFSLAAIFQLITLPTEFNASKRALVALEGRHILEADELQGAKKTLSAAAMTYVAALAVSLASLIRLLAIVRRRQN